MDLEGAFETFQDHIPICLQLFSQLLSHAWPYSTSPVPHKLWSAGHEGRTQLLHALVLFLLKFGSAEQLLQLTQSQFSSTSSPQQSQHGTSTSSLTTLIQYLIQLLFSPAAHRDFVTAAGLALIILLRSACQPLSDPTILPRAVVFLLELAQNPRFPADELKRAKLNTLFKKIPLLNSMFQSLQNISFLQDQREQILSNPTRVLATLALIRALLAQCPKASLLIPFTPLSMDDTMDSENPNTSVFGVTFPEILKACEQVDPQLR